MEELKRPQVKPLLARLYGFKKDQFRHRSVRCPRHSWQQTTSRFLVERVGFHVVQVLRSALDQEVREVELPSQWLVSIAHAAAHFDSPIAESNADFLVLPNEDIGSRLPSPSDALACIPVASYHRRLH